MIISQLNRLNKFFTRTTGILMSLCVAAMAILIITSVIVRNLLGFSFQWIVDVNRLIFIWMCFLGLVYVSDKDVLIRFDILEKRFTLALQKLFTLCRYIASLVLFLIMIKAGLAVSEFAKVQVFSTIPVSTQWLYIAVVTAGLLLVFQTVVKILLLVTHQDTESGFTNPK